MLNKRLLNLLGAGGCTGLMGYALFAQFQLGLAPCPLCILQRIAVIVLGCIFLLAALHNPGRRGSVVYAGLLALTALTGIAVAWRHVWLQGLPADKVPSCGPGLDFMLDAFPVAEVLKMVLSGSGECAELSWSFLHLSMPAWVLITLALVGIYGVYVNLRS